MITLGWITIFTLGAAIVGAQLWAVCHGFISLYLNRSKNHVQR